MIEDHGDKLIIRVASPPDWKAHAEKLAHEKALLKRQLEKMDCKHYPQQIEELKKELLKWKERCLEYENIAHKLSIEINDLKHGLKP